MGSPRWNCTYSSTARLVSYIAGPPSALVPVAATDEAAFACAFDRDFFLFFFFPAFPANADETREGYSARRYHPAVTPALMASATVSARRVAGNEESDMRLDGRGFVADRVRRVGHPVTRVPGFSRTRLEKLQ